MKRKRTLGLLAAALMLLVCAVPQVGLGQMVRTADAPPVIRPTERSGAVAQVSTGVQAIVELEGEPAALALQGALFARPGVMSFNAQIYRGMLARQRAEVVKRAEKHGVSLKVLQRYELTFNGLAVQVASQEDLAKLAALPGVKAVHEDGTRELYLDRSAPYVGAGTLAAGAGEGEGVIVGVIDSGIDWKHADLGGNGPDKITSFPTPKVIGGWDFVGRKSLETTFIHTEEPGAPPRGTRLSTRSGPQSPAASRYCARTNS